MSAIENLRKVYNYLDNHAASDEADLIAEVIQELENPWRAMETAPIDGEEVLLLFDDESLINPYAITGYHSLRAWRTVNHVSGKPSYWMPHPSLPTCKESLQVQKEGL